MEFFQKYFSAVALGLVAKYSLATANTLSTGATPSLFGQSLPKDHAVLAEDLHQPVEPAAVGLAGRSRPSPERGE